MDLSQKKLTRSEWNALEVPVDAKEFGILKLIHNIFKQFGYVR